MKLIEIVYNTIKKDSTEYEILRNRYGLLGFDDFKQKQEIITK